MRASIAAAALTLSSTALAQFFTNASEPFGLVLSANETEYDNHVLIPCHEGAAIEALCVGGPYTAGNATKYYTFNSTDFSIAHPPAKGGAEGILVYSLPGNGFDASSALSLSYNPVSNVAVPLFQPGDEEVTQVAFDKDEKLNIQGSIDAGLPPQANETAVFYRWQVCKTYEGYSYTTLAWVVGWGYPDNPTCKPATVTRVWS